MRVVVPYTPGMLSAAVPYALRAHPADVVEWRPTEGERGYWDLMRGLWREGRSFVVVEQDVVPWPGAVEALWACPSDWCCHDYSDEGVPSPMLGCTKIGAGLIARNPGIWDGRPRGGFSAGIDMHLWERCSPGADPHFHHPPVTHLRCGFPPRHHLDRIVGPLRGGPPSP